MHYLFEITDFSNPDYKDFNAFEVNCIEKFINTGILMIVKKFIKNMNLFIIIVIERIMALLIY